MSEYEKLLALVSKAIESHKEGSLSDHIANSLRDSGLVRVLPCKPGEPLWCVLWDEGEKPEILQTAGGFNDFAITEHGIFLLWDGDNPSSIEVGKDYFRTREEAEAVVREVFGE